ncbi:MAG: DUF2232 domain-containing protein [Syntrophomonadaceae bacterium]|nr:DUF2232 domain-containing protein [Syntrophomonadaceae bacterium]
MITSVLCLLLAGIPSLTFIMAIMWGAALILGGLYLKQSQILVIYGINTLLLYVIAGGSGLFFYLFFFGIAAFTMGLLVVNKKTYYDVQKWGIITAVITVSLFIGMIYLNTGGIGVEEMESQLNNYLEETIEAYEESGIMDFYEDRGLSQTDIEQTFSHIVATMAKHLPAFYYLQAILAVFFMLILASFVSQKRKIERLKKRPYDQEVMPWQLVWVVIAGLSLWLIGREEMSLVYYTGSNLLVVLVPIAVYFGLATVIYKLKQRKTSTRNWIITFLVIITVIFPLSAIIFLAVVGLFDSLLDHRKLRVEKGD